MKSKLVVLLGVCFVAAIAIRNQDSRERQNFHDCKDKIREISFALEEWSVDHNSYPESLSQLFKKGELVCPNSRTDTYSESYHADESGGYVLYCSGSNHLGYPENMPSASIPERGH